MKDSIVKLLSERYFLKEEKSWEDIAERLKWIYPEIYEYLLDFRFMFSSPTIMNANTKGERVGTLSSCFTMDVEDSIDGIGDGIKECMQVTKMGGGVGYDFSSLRSSKEGVNGLGGKLSSGPLPFINIFNEVLDGVQQGGCLIKDTYIQTKNGLYIFDELIDTNNENGWHEHNIDCQTKENKLHNSNKFYVNGLDNVITLKTKEGIEITGTHNHKLYIFNNNGFEYKEIQNINKDDYLCVKLGSHIGQDKIELKQIDINDYHFNCKIPEFPINLTEEFSFFIGLLVGDGFIASNKNDYRVGITIADDSYLVNTLKDLMLKLFPNSNVLFMKKENDASQTLYFSNKAIKDFLTINGIVKESSTEAIVPKIIRESNKEIIGSFLKGLFEADASISHGYPELITSSKRLAKDVQQLLFGIGSPNKIYKHKKHNSFSKNQYIYGVKILSFVGLDCWKKYIGCENGSRFEKIYNFSSNLDKEKNYKIPNFSYWIDEDISNLNIKLRKKINRYKNNKRNFTYSAYVNLKEDIKFKDIDNIYFSQIELKTYEKELKETYDLEIAEVHNYIANGIISHNSRRGAGMAMLDIDHPNIIDFIEAKKDYTTNAFSRFNFSIRVPDWFYKKLEKSPDSKHCVKLKSGEQKELDITVKDVWDLIIDRAWSSAEPGIFNSSIAEEQCTLTNISNKVLSNPCQEYVSIPYSSCNLGSINVEKFVIDGKFDWDGFIELIKIATIALDKVIDKNKFPIKNIENITKKVRPIGLGIMGLAHCLYKLGLPYASKEALKFVKNLFINLTLESMKQSVELAKEFGSYPAFDYGTFMDANKRFHKHMNDQLKEDLKQYGCRNSCQTSIAPTGSIGFIADTSSGIEPVFALTYARKIEKLNKEYEVVYISDPVFDEYINNNYDEKTIEKILKNVAENNGSCQKCKELSEVDKSIFVVAGDLTPMEHLNVLEQVANNISLSVSKTINLPKNISKEEVSEVYIEAYKKGIIGVTVYRDGSREGILVHQTEDGDKIIERDAPKRPKELPCHIYRITVKGEKWIVFIGMYEGHPYEVFAGRVGDLDIGSSIETGIMERVKSGHYRFKKEDNTVIVDNVVTLFANDEQEALTRQISTNLRHGTPIDFVIEQLRKSHGTIVDFNKAILKALGKYQKNKDGGVCENCGSKMIYFDGCISCMNPECGNSKCG